jgi:hypothetical protein
MARIQVLHAQGLRVKHLSTPTTGALAVLANVLKTQNLLGRLIPPPPQLDLCGIHVDAYRVACDLLLHSQDDATTAVGWLVSQIA